MKNEYYDVVIINYNNPKDVRSMFADNLREARGLILSSIGLRSSIGSFWRNDRGNIEGNTLDISEEAQFGYEIERRCY
jgi:hypothetical protein